MRWGESTRGQGEARAHRCSGVLEAVEPGGGGLGADLGGKDGLHDLAHDLPQLPVLVAEQDDDAGGLHVVRRRAVQHELVHDLLNALLGDDQVARQLVVCATILGQVEEGLGAD